MTQFTHTNTRESDDDLTRRADRISKISPEGTPAHPEVTSRGINIALLSIVVAMLAIALAVAVVFSPIAGVVLGVIALLALLLNPVFWASFHRANERETLENSG
ncbi:unnamed protein product [Symbiodinium necroappetens]|uniref:Uncharacterized protein n=1 Tax=Symbiodinium necroappetens TaxID=1628268 RepID=A0A813BEB4_9DINO|nr:unnamed protein product [Symbiodinium necroappetens]